MVADGDGLVVLTFQFPKDFRVILQQLAVHVGAIAFPFPRTGLIGGFVPCFGSCCPFSSFLGFFGFFFRFPGFFFGFFPASFFGFFFRFPGFFFRFRLGFPGFFFSLFPGFFFRFCLGLFFVLFGFCPGFFLGFPFLGFFSAV